MRSKARFESRGGCRRKQPCPAILHLAGLVLIAVDLAAQQVLHHGGDQRAREEVRGHDRQHHGQRQGRKQIARRAGEEDHRHEHDADAQGGNERRNGDLLRAIQNGLDDGLALPQVAMDVLDFDRGVVHQNADRQRQAAQRHHVDGFAQQVQDRRARSGWKAGWRCRR